MKKKMCVLMAAVAMLAISSSVCKEVRDKNSYYFYYSGEYGTSSYKIDWDSFYDRMDKAANSGIYKYIQVTYRPIAHGGPNRCVLDSSYSEDSGEYAEFMYIKGEGGFLRMFFSTRANPYAEYMPNYQAAVKKWNYYIDLM